jgi:hypothetical protein
MLYGLQGPITVNGHELQRPHAGLGAAERRADRRGRQPQSSPASTAPEGFDAIRADEVAAARGQGLTAARLVYDAEGPSA